MSSFCGDDVDWRLLFLFVKPKCRLVWCKRRWNWPRAWPVSPLINNRMSLSLSSSLTIHRLWLFDYLTIWLLDYLTLWLSSVKWTPKRGDSRQSQSPFAKRKGKATCSKWIDYALTLAIFLFCLGHFGGYPQFGDCVWLCLTVGVQHPLGDV